jgi:hypothetical protein
MVGALNCLSNKSPTVARQRDKKVGELMRKHGGTNSFSFVSTGIDLTSENAILVRGAVDFSLYKKGA